MNCCPLTPILFVSTQGFVQLQSLHTFKLEIISLYTWIKPFRIGPCLTDENATEILWL